MALVKEDILEKIKDLKAQNPGLEERINMLLSLNSGGRLPDDKTLDIVNKIIDTYKHIGEIRKNIKTDNKNNVEDIFKDLKINIAPSSDHEGCGC